MSRLLIKEETRLTFKNHYSSPSPQTVGGGKCDVREPIVDGGLGFHAVISSQHLSLDQIPKWRLKEWPKCKRLSLWLVRSVLFYKTIRHFAECVPGERAG